MGRAVLQLRRNTQAFWEDLNIIPAAGEPIFAIDTKVLKIGDGVTHYTSLTSISGTGGTGTEWHDGSGPPSNVIGKNGDYYLNTANGDVWKKLSGVYALTGNIQGPEGDQGDTGPSGAALNYTHTQAVPASVWTVIHNLGKRPSVTIFDSANDEVEGDIVHNSVNQLTLTFSAAFGGVAYCN